MRRAGSIPDQALHPVAMLVEEDEQMTGLRVLVDHVDDQAREPVESLAHVDRLARDEDPHQGRGREAQHRDSAPTTRRRWSASNSALMRRR